MIPITSLLLTISEKAKSSLEVGTEIHSSLRHAADICVGNSISLERQQEERLWGSFLLYLVPAQKNVLW